jgi:hypothetical protein
VGLSLGSLLKSDLQTSTIVRTLFSDEELRGEELVLNVALYVDARKMMRRYNQTEWGYKLLNNRTLAQVNKWIRAVTVYEGKDDHFLLDAHSELLMNEVDTLEDGLLPIFVANKKIKFKFLFMSDGAGRRAMHGVGSAASKFPMGYNDLPQELVSRLDVFAPITRNKLNMQQHEPPFDLDHKQRTTWARKNHGIYGHNVTRRDLTCSPPDSFHQALLCMPRVLAFTYRAIMDDPNGSTDKFEKHLQDLGLAHNVMHVEKDGRVEIKMYGNDCRSLFGKEDQIMYRTKHTDRGTRTERQRENEAKRQRDTEAERQRGREAKRRRGGEAENIACGRASGQAAVEDQPIGALEDDPDGPEFMSIPQQSDAITQVWKAAAFLVKDLKNTDLDKALAPLEFFRAAHLFLEKATAVFGSRFVTPTMRELRDQNPFYIAMLRDMKLTLADVAVDSFEAHHREQKRRWHQQLMAGGRGNDDGPLRGLLVCF